MTIAQNLDALQKNLQRAPQPVTLVAVSKQQPLEKIHEALAYGQRIFGENRVQEARARWQDLRPDYPDLQLHLIGPLQTNKVHEAVELFDVIETVDREKLARALADEMKRQGRTLSCFIQVNTGAEPQKSGVAPENLEKLVTYCRKDCGLNIIGLMCIPPLQEPPALHFSLLKKLAGRYQLPCLSMGMSGDYEAALALGATHIRLGTAVFGERA